MISEKMQVALNQQLNEELYSSYLYLSMAAYFEEKNLSGMANWMRLQADEEHQHAMKFYDFIIKVGGKVTLEAIAKPKTQWESASEVFEESLIHERHITQNINELTDLAIQEKDHSTNTFLHWFIDEQVEEESTVEQIVQSFRMIGDSHSGLFMLDRELGGRSASAAV